MKVLVNDTGFRVLTHVLMEKIVSGPGSEKTNE